MRPIRLAGISGWLGAGLLLCGFAWTDALANRGPSSITGPTYSSPEAIRYAQMVLEQSDYLKSGSYAKGERDQATISAIRQFQRAHFLSPTGQLTTDTMGLLSSHARKERGVPASPAGQASRAGSAPVTVASAPRTMPETGSPFEGQAALGTLIIAFGAGLLLWRRRV